MRFMTRFFSEHWNIAKSSSQHYKIAQVAALLILFAASSANFLVLELDDLPGEFSEYLARSLIEGMLFVLVTHFCIRGYLKLNFINKGMSFVGGFKLLFIILVACTISVFLSVQIGELPVFEASQPQSVKFEMDGKTIDLSMSDPSMWFLMISNVFIFYLGWTLIYIFWHAAKSKRELQKQMQEARIQQLTNQLSPHFLFNTLNSIRALIFEDKEKAADLVTNLSEIFRTHLHAHLQSKATLEQEWQVANRYLTIEKARLEERLKITCNIDEELWQQPLPTLCLLTLIENAIKHGIAPNPEHGFLDIHSHVENDEQWRLIIRNSVSDNKSEEGTKTGLKNTQTRLELMFGNKVQFRAARKDDTFVVSIEMPYV